MYGWSGLEGKAEVIVFVDGQHGEGLRWRMRLAQIVSAASGCRTSAASRAFSAKSYQIRSLNWAY